MGHAPSPLTVGTAGHVDHGKTSLVAALTGTDTDRLPEEKTRGLSIALGYAQLTLPSGRTLSVVDVPGHERFVRTMVAGATGIDLVLMTIAADDGVMPQTREHAAVLRALRVERGVVAITKSDLADPARARSEAAELLPAFPSVGVSVRAAEGLDDLRSALDAVAAEVPPRGGEDGPPRLHVDRVFTIRGAGTVVTGTLWSGSIGRGDELPLRPSGRRVRVRGVEVHDLPVERAGAGQRVAVNLTGVGVEDVSRGDVLGGTAGAAYRLRAALDARATPGRVQIHHGTRDAPARVSERDGHWLLRLERPLLAEPGDRFVIRSISPPDTLGGGVVLAEPAVEREEPAACPAPAPRPLSAAARELEERLRSAGHEPPLDADLAAEPLAELRAAGRAVRVGPALHFHPDALAAVRGRVEALGAERAEITIARLRDNLGTSRKFAQVLLEHFDSERVTVRRGDAHVLRRRRD